MNSTRIIFWNTQGITHKCLELLQFVQEHKIDILLLNETHLSNRNYFKLPNFFSYYSNSPQWGNKHPAGGTAILIHRRIVHHRINITTNSINNTTIHINIGNSELRLSAVYKSPKTKIQTIDIDELLNTQANTIIAGDLNAKHHSWNSRIINKAGRLSDYLDTRNDTTVAAPTSSTHYPSNPNHRPDVLDIAIMKTGQIQYQLENMPTELTSDHSPLILDLFHNSSRMSPPKPTHTINWSEFKLRLEDVKLKIPPVKTKQQINDTIRSITLILS